MRYPHLSLFACVLLAVACSTDAPSITGTDALSLSKGKPAPATGSWLIPTDPLLSFRGDGQSIVGDHDVYANGVCGNTVKFFTGATESGDATLQTTAPKGNKCGRRFWIDYPTGEPDLVASFNNLHRLQNPEHMMPIGATKQLRFVINTSAINVPSRCGRVIFGNNQNNVAPGSDMLSVTRTNARTWQVESDGTALGYCENLSSSNNHVLYPMRVSFVIVAEQDLPVPAP